MFLIDTLVFLESNMKTVKIDELIKRATNNKKINSFELFRPSDFYKLLYDPFWIWCRFHAPEEEKKEEIDRHRDLLMQRGVDFEEKWLKANYPQAREVKASYGLEAIKETLNLMIEGVNVIYQPHLSLLEKEIYGKGDLLVKSKKASSDLGGYHYIVKEVKNSKEVKNYHTLQAGIYNYMLGVIQGFTSPEINIVLKDSEEKTISYNKVSEEMTSLLNYWKDIRANREKPEPRGIDKTDSPWRLYANKILIENYDLTLLPDIGPATRKTIRNKLQVKNIKDLENYTKSQLVDSLGVDLGEKTYNCTLAYKLNKVVPVDKKINKNETNKKIYYFDFETSDEVHQSEPPHVYLIGLWDKEKNKFKYFLGRGKQDEARIFSEFLDYIGNLDDVILYHWSDYEIGEIDKIIEQYPKLAFRLTKLKNACVDLKEVVKNNFYIPVPDYSIKKVAPFWGEFSWRQKDVNAYESMVLYWDWLENQQKGTIQKVIDYNEDDCKALVYVDEKLFN